MKEFRPVYFEAPLPQIPEPPRVRYQPVEPLLQFQEITKRPSRPVRRRAAKKAKKRRVLRVVKKKRKARPKVYRDYPGDELFVVEVEGIGPVWEKRLIKAGVPTTTRLAYEKPAKLAKRIKAPEKTVRSWHAMSQLIKVRDIGPQFAEILSRAGIRGIEDLKRTPAEKIEKKLNRYLDSLDSTIIGRRPTIKRIKGWKRHAARMKKVVLPVPSTKMPKDLPWYAKLRIKKAEAKGRGRKAKRKTGKK